MDTSNNRQIGAGQCGIVYTLPPDTVVKVSRPGKEAALLQDYNVHVLITKRFQALSSPSLISIPACWAWITQQDYEFWTVHDLDSDENSVALISDRIPALPSDLCSVLYHALAPLHISWHAACSIPENRDVLVRLYLGCRQQRSPTSTFKLRNLDLAVNEMEALNLDTTSYAKTLAHILALLHWQVGIDANDVEFVLGCERGESTSTLHELEVWLLDFNMCQSIEGKESGAAIQQLVEGVYWNDPYYPRPGSGDARDEALWVVFKKAYLETSKAVEGNRGEEFIAAWEEFARKKKPVGLLF